MPFVHYLCALISITYSLLVISLVYHNVKGKLAHNFDNSISKCDCWKYSSPKINYKYNLIKTFRIIMILNSIRLNSFTKDS